MPKKQQYRIRNWSEYNKSLIKRGSLTMWFNEKSIQRWHKAKMTGHAGRPFKYADAAIECMLTIKSVFKLPLRATQGLVNSLIKLLQLPLEAADYTTLCRRQSKLDLSMTIKNSSEPLHAVFDSTGLKIFGEGEWKVRQHGYSKRRTWRKLHLGVDEATGEIIASVLSTNDLGDSEVLPDLLEQISAPIEQASGDGAYDSFENYGLLEKRGAKITIPPRESAKLSKPGGIGDGALSRNKNIRAIHHVGRALWKKRNGYHRRSIAETTIFRYKTLLGSSLSAIRFDHQAVEAFIKCNALNKMTHLGMPDSYAIA